MYLLIRYGSNFILVINFTNVNSWKLRVPIDVARLDHETDGIILERIPRGYDYTCRHPPTHGAADNPK